MCPHEMHACFNPFSPDRNVLAAHTRTAAPQKPSLTSHHQYQTLHSIKHPAPQKKQMLDWAKGKHRGYLKTYGDEYKKLRRKAMIPFVI